MKSSRDHTVGDEELELEWPPPPEDEERGRPYHLGTGAQHTYQPPYGYACLFAAQLIMYVLNDVQVLAAPPKLFPSNLTTGPWGIKYCAT